jgi:hypothetical protein
MDAVFNWGLFKHPANWFIIILMVIIASYAFHFASSFVSTHVASNLHQ